MKHDGWRLVGEYSALRRVTLTDTEIIIEGHCGVAEVDEERFPREGFVADISNLIRVYTNIEE